MRRTHLAWAALLGLIVAQHLPALGGGFVWDDVILLRDNAAVHALGGAWSAAWGDFFGQAAGQPTAGYLRPVPTLLNAATWAVWGDDPLPFRGLNLGLHLVATGLLGALALDLGLSGLGALTAATIFGLHPVQVEAVAFISARSDLLAAVGVLAMALAHRRGRVGWAWATFALALLSKEVALGAPLALWGLDRAAPTGRGGRRIWLGYGALVLAVVGARISLGVGTAPRLYFPAAQAPLAALGLLARYGWMWVRPPGRALYDHLSVGAGDPWALPGGAMVLVGLTLLARTRLRTVPGAAALWAGLFIAPVLHIVPLPTLAAERYLYLPTVGLALMGGLGIARMPRRVARPLVACAALLLAASSALRAADWHDERSLWRAETEHPDASYKAWQNLAVADAERGAWAPAMDSISQAAARAPHDERVWRNLVRVAHGLCGGLAPPVARAALRPRLSAPQLESVAAHTRCAALARAARRRAAPQP